MIVKMNEVEIMVEFGIDWQNELKNEMVAAISGKTAEEEIRINTKTISVFGGSSMVGKTATCLHLAADAVKRGKMVYYIDTESKPITNRPEPNFFKKLSGKNPEGFKRYFVYERNFDPENLPKLLDNIKPKLLIIDSIYEPYISAESKLRVDNPYGRTKAIREFLNRLRTWIFERGIAVVITTPAGKDAEDLKGGNSLLYLSDSKLYVKFIGEEEKGGEIAGKRLYQIDKHHAIPFMISEEGEIVFISGNVSDKNLKKEKK